MAGLCPPADASPAPSRMPAHGSGPMWIVLRHRVGLVPTTRRRSPGALRTKHRERLSAHGSVDHHWRGHLIVTQRVDEGDGLPAPNETRPISLTPRGARLLSRTMLVLAAVSSMLRLTLCLRQVCRRQVVDKHSAKLVGRLSTTGKSAKRKSSMSGSYSKPTALGVWASSDRASTVPIP
jgi:hypothetical protein